MATTINTTALDFDSIKENLKEKLSASPEFADYDFEASGLSSIMDVLAYNTHYNALIANFALNEAYISTAQLRPSMVGLVEGMGYIPDSVAGAKATINISLNLSGVVDRPNQLFIPSGSTFTSSIEGVSYTFNTSDNLYGYDNGSGLYNFETGLEVHDIVITEGKSRAKEFIVSPGDEDKLFVIPDLNMDTSTVIVKVFRTRGSNIFNYYTSVTDAVEITNESRVYLLKESPNGFYELGFGDGNTFGTKLVPGNIVQVSYIAGSGPGGNGATLFVPDFEVDVNGVGYTPAITTVFNSSGGAAKESIESMRKNAPFHLSSQNRMVTAEDYVSVILRKFPSYIKDIRSYGGQDADDPIFGKVVLCVLFNDGLPESTVTQLKQQITELVERLAIVSFGVVFEEPVQTYLGVGVFFDYNSSQTTLSPARIQGQVKQTIEAFTGDNIGSFDKSFRRSNLLSVIDDQETFILSSRADVVMNQQFTPRLNVPNTLTLSFPVDIATFDDVNYTITSTRFIYNGHICYIRNKLGSTQLQIFDNEIGAVVVDNVGYFEPIGGKVYIVGFTPDRLVGGLNYMKIKAVPANQSSITPTRNHVLLYDEDESFASGIKLES
jgi:hypothetical protein